MRPRLSIILAGAWVTICAGLQLGCVQYATPGAGMRPVNLAAAEEDIAARLERRAAAPFPARLAIARVQAPGYRSHSAEGYGRGKFSVVTVRDVETGKDFERLSSLPLVAGVAPLNRLILPEQLNSDKELRLAAAALHTDILLLYSFDTNFRIDGRDIGPLGLITLGFLPVDEAVVTSTVSAALFDVRTGFVFGVAEGSATQSSPRPPGTRATRLTTPAGRPSGNRSTTCSMSSNRPGSTSSAITPVRNRWSPHQDPSVAPRTDSAA